MIKRALTILSILAYMGLSMRNCLYPTSAATSAS